MDKIKQLEITKLINELEYLRTDYRFKNESIVEGDVMFIKEINRVLSENPELMEKFNKADSVEEEEEETPNSESKFDTEEDVEEEIEPSEELEKSVDTEKNPRMKKLFNKIVKLTHPDREKRPHYNELYLQAIKFYEDDDRVGLYKICDKLSIPYEMEEDDIDSINENIESYKKKISFLESTLTWMWVSSKTKEEKDSLVMSYINMKTR